jgi:hypothetical protein
MQKFIVGCKFSAHAQVQTTSSRPLIFSTRATETLVWGESDVRAHSNTPLCPKTVKAVINRACLHYYRKRKLRLLLPDIQSTR